MPNKTEAVEGSTDHLKPTSSKDALIKKLFAIAYKSAEDKSTVKIQEAAVDTLGEMNLGEFPHPLATDIATGLFQIPLKLLSSDLQFAVGQALSLVGAGSASDAAEDEWHVREAQPPAAAAAAAATTTTTTTASAAVNAAPDGVAAMELDGKSSAAVAGPMAFIVDDIIDKWSKQNLSRVRQAAAVWLLNIIKFTGHVAQVQSRLQRVQSVFTDMLAENDDVTQVGVCVCVCVCV